MLAWDNIDHFYKKPPIKQDAASRFAINLGIKPKFLFLDSAVHKYVFFAKTHQILN